MVAIREVLCATKIENPADAALRYSFFIIERFHCALHVLHASEAASAPQRNRYVSSAQRMKQVLASHRLREQLDEVVRTVGAAGTGHAMSHVADGNWTEAVLAFSERQRTDVIVLGSSSEHRDGALSSGPLIDHFSQRTSCPVLTVPSLPSCSSAVLPPSSTFASAPVAPTSTSTATATAPVSATTSAIVSSFPSAAFDTQPRLERMLLALDPEATTGSLVEWAALWAQRFGAVVRLFYCEPPLLRARQARARWQHEAEGTLRAAGVQIDDCIAVSRASLAERVLSQASLDSSDLIMMSASLRDDTDTRILATIRRRSSAPVLSVRHAPPDRLFVDPALDPDVTASIAFDQSSNAVTADPCHRIRHAS